MAWLTVQQDETHHDVKTSQIRPYRDRMRTSDPSPSARWVDIEGAVFDLVVWNAFWTQIYLQSRLCLRRVLFCFFSERIKISLHESTNSLRAPFWKSILKLFSRRLRARDCARPAEGRVVLCYSTTTQCVARF